MGRESVIHQGSPRTAYCQRNETTLDDDGESADDQSLGRSCVSVLCNDLRSKIRFRVGVYGPFHLWAASNA